jgi:hypothetical protein
MLVEEEEEGKVSGVETKKLGRNEDGGKREERVP